MTSQRIRKLRAVLKAQKIGALLVTKSENIRYLTNFPASDSWLLVCPKKIYYITDARYTLEARKGLKNVQVVDHKGLLYDTAFALVKQNRLRTLGFDEHHFTHAQYKVLKKKCPKSIRLIAANQWVEALREFKDADEIACTKKALKIHDEALRYLRRVIKPGLTERDVFLKLEQFVKAKKVGFSFDSIVASGPNSCLPHAMVTDRRICRNDLVLLDFGIDYKGYKSDLTRMVFLGKIPRFVQQIHDFVAEAQRLAIASVRPGAVIAHVDFAARHYLDTQKVAKYFGHSLGHGVGLEIHESPGVSSRNKGLLEEGMIITIEPGVYIPNKFGIRLEEMVLVTRKGCKVLSDNID